MASPAPESIFLEDFGQTVDLTRRIREVLLTYPEGTTVLKELIQNADDAGATTVSLCLDRRSHGGDSLLSNSLAQWQGPALLAYNDAVFTEDDFVSISKIGGSSKHGQASKTGRFGVGFNSVYHLTDLPSFVSGKYVVLFDPQGVYLPRVSASNPGKRIDFAGSSALSFYRDQFSPYCAFGCNMQSPFSGTLFRFPLRNADQAAKSKLSRQAYSPEDISSMFVQLFEEGVLTLLFLKSVLCIEMYLWDVGEPEPKKIYSCSVSSVTDDTVWHRQALLRLSKCLNSTSEVDAFPLDFLSERINGDEAERQTEKFYVVQTMASMSSRIGSFATTASKEYDIHLLPWASIAACISDNSLNSNILRTGQAFCFLPLPVRTGLSVQVNGFFEVSSNRRGIWYGDDMDRSGKVRSIWNRLLLEDLVAPAFMHMLLGIKELLGPTDIYYSLWPIGSFEEPWNNLVQQIYKNIGNSPVMYSDVSGGRWVSPNEAFLHDEKFTKSEDLSLALMQLGMPVVHLPNTLFDMLLQYSSSKFMIRSSNTEEDILSRYYGVERMGKAQFYKQHVFNRVNDFQADVRDSIMLSVLQNLPLLSLEDISIKNFLRNLKFIPTLNGDLKCPSVLYDPSNEELYALLEDSGSFPAGAFRESEILNILRGLGLRTSVSPETILESARCIERLMHGDQQKAYLRGKVLFSYLEVNALKSFNTKSDLEKFWNDLRLISWCPVLVSTPFQSLPWPVVTSMVAPPKVVRPLNDLWLVSASMRVLDGECSSTALLYGLGWMSPPGGGVIAAQLLELGKNNEIVSDQVLRQELALAMPRIYSILTGMIATDEIEIVKVVLEGCRWIWVGDGFATSDEVVLDGPLHLAPYIRVIPVDLAVFKNLFLELGIREFLQPADYANILCRMAVRKGSSPLDTQEIRAVTLIVHHLAEVYHHEQKVQLYLPDVSGRLFLAEKLGVCSLRRMLLAESSDSMNFGLSGAAEAFGQHEALTTRLKHILEMYADGPGTLFELVQNAEDAGASETSPCLFLEKILYCLILMPVICLGFLLHTLVYELTGTLFRFPLRTAGVASRSQIKKEVYTPEDVRSLFATFSEVVSETLLFLHNVKSISIFVKEGTGHEMHLLHRKILITEQSTSSRNSHYWITTECLGDGNAQKRTSETVNSNCYNFVPWACVAAYLNSVKVDGNLVEKSFEGRAFCFLPLPISTGLPAHVNAYFELSSNRRDIWFGSDMAGGGRKRSEWNIYLLENVVAPAYGRLLEKIASEIGPCNLFFSLWPTTLGLEPWASAVRKLYQFVAEFNLRVLYTDARGGQWISTKHAIFPDFTFPKVVELIKALSGASLPVITLPQTLSERFMEICPSLHFLTPKLLRTLLIRRKRELKDRDAMILTLEYCLHDLQESMQFDTLCGLPLLPVADGSFTSVDMRGSGERVYLARGDEYGLLKDSIPRQLVDCAIPKEVHKKLCYIAQTDGTNISFLSCQLLEKLLVKLLPVEWQHARQVSWTPGIHGQPSVEWLQLLWNYLKLYCDDLLMFSKWPILPVGDNCLMQLTQNLNVIRNEGWSEKMCSLLLKVGSLFLRHDLLLDHPKLEYFVQSATARGVLNVFLAIAGEPQKIEGIFTDVSEGELHELRSFVLQSKWFSEEQIDDTHVEIIRHLPIFESYKSRKLTSLSNPIKWLGPTGVCEDLLNDYFIRTESEMERVIMKRYLGMKEPTKVEFYKDHIFNHMSEFLSKQEVVSAILHDVQHLIKEDISVKSSFSSARFVLSANGSWEQPSRLYDPRVPHLKKLLHVNVFFPSDKFLDPEILDTLVCLGLRTTLGFTGLLDCARSVSLLHDSGDTDTSRHGGELLDLLDTLAFRLSNKGESNNGDQLGAVINSFLRSSICDIVEEEFWSELKLISWCPVISDPAVRGLPWLKSNNQVVAPPTSVRPKSQMWMVSSSMFILDGECNTYLQTKLGWMDCPNVDVLTRQLIELSKSYQQLKIHSMLDPGFDAQLQNEIPCLYSKLQEYISTDDFNKLKGGLDGISWVWIGDDFVLPNALAFDSPVKFTPYLYVVPSELSEYKDLMLKLGVRLSFGVSDYLHVLQRLQNDVHGVSLSTDQLNFVHCVLEAIAECCLEKPLFEPFESPLLIPNDFGVLMQAGDLVYNDAPWLQNSSLIGRHFVHPIISNDLADKLGVQSIRCLSLVSDDLTKDLPCMDYNKVKELLTLYGNNEFLLFDLLELADCCKAKRLHLIYDKREHPRQSLLQHNLGEFQGPALIAIFEGACLSREEFSNFQLRPPWRLRGNTINYGLGLVCCYSICDILSVISGGYFYMFDPRGLVLGAPSTNGPSAKMFSLIGTDLKHRFCDQFSPMLIDRNDLWSLADSTIIRMPLSSDCLKVGPDLESNRIKHIIDIFMEHGSRALLFLKSVLQVSISTWEEGHSHPCQNFSISIDPSSSILRNPFLEKKWRKFQLSRIFSSSNAVIKMHVIDVNLYSEGTTVMDRWLVVLSLGSGQTRNMALDRRYLAYNLTPVAGIAALISRNGDHANVYSMSSIMAPLPLSGSIKMPVTILGCFLVCHNRGRYLFKYQDRGASAEGHFDAGNQLIESWNREVMSCVCDAYVEMVLEIQKLRRNIPSSIIDSSACSAISLTLKDYGDQIYSFWPRSCERHVLSDQLANHDNNPPSSIQVVLKADWECLKERVIHPFYSRIIDLPVWQLYSGNLVKAEEGMFLSQPGNGLIASSGDALEMMTSLGKALFDFGRGVVEDIGRTGTPMHYRNAETGIDLNRDQKFISIAAELKGLPFPTATSHLKKLGLTELWIGNKEQQSLMVPLGEKFIHPNILDRPLLGDIFSNFFLQSLLKLQNFSLNLVANHMSLIFHRDWVNHVMGSNMVPWLSWEKLPSSGSQGGPSPEWIRIFWKSFRGSQEELSLFSDWPLIPAFLGRPVLCRVRERHLVFIPPLLEHPMSTSGVGVSRDNTSEAELAESHISAFERFKTSFPWLLPMLNQCNIPIIDEAFIDCVTSSNCFPVPGRSLGHVIASKLVAAKQAGYFTEPTNLSTSNCDALFSLFSDEFFSNDFHYAREEIEVLRSLPIYKTVVGSYTKLQGQDQCMIPSNSFLKPYDERCLSYATDSNESSFLRVLGVLELHNQQILTKFVRNSDEFSTDLFKPVDLFDPGDAILISIFFGERRKFPGERFSTDGWLRMLRKLGLRTATEVDVIIECAKRVEFLGIECMKSGDMDDFEADTINTHSEVSQEVWALGGSVVEFVFSNFALFFSNNFCDLLGKIACVPAELGFPGVGCKRVLASYNEAILPKDWPLAWSCAPILSKQHTGPPEYSWGPLHLRSPPAFCTVLKHLQVIGRNGGEDTLAHWPIASGMNIEECTCEILKYLDKNWGSLSSTDLAELCKVAFLPVANGTRLVAADALFARLMINLSPFAFELPNVYLPFVRILKDLGLQDMLTLSAAKGLLLNLQKACGYQRLNPNELRAVMEILNFISDQIVEGNTLDGSNWKSEAIIPDDGCRLVHSASCVYVDSYGSRYVKCIDTSRIRFVHADLPERVCIVLGIKKLSDVVIEELDENHTLQTLGSLCSVLLVTIKQKLTSKSLQTAVWIIANSMGSYIPAFNSFSLDTIEYLLNSAAEKLQFVKCLKTKFLLLPNLVDVTRAGKDFTIPEWENDSAHQTLYFMNQSRSCILVAEPPTYVSLFDLIAIIVSQVLGSPIILPIGSLFGCPEGAEIAVVNVLKLCSDKKEVEPINGSSNMVGKEILPQDARLVQFHPLRPFYSGEIVAWRSQHGEKLKYGKVSEDVRPSAGQALYRIKIEVAPGDTQIFLSSQVFSFRSVSASSPLKESLVRDSPVLSSNGPQVDFPESSGRGESYSQVQPVREQSGKVSAAELVQAVNEILSAAGIKMDVEKQALLQRTINLQENLKESQAALVLEQERVEKATKEADTAKAAWICRVCLSAEVDITIVPCGHVLCRKCSSAVSRCPFCRLQVTKSIRIFRP
uniref:Sacsin n=1 Tax=Cajanus cajan TaxID=3821 RepID=A0A151R3C6_CAJCA|nr:Sacsin [Cajanus cajan]